MIQLAAIIVSSVPTNALAMAVVGAGAGVYLFYRGFRLLQRRRLILNTPSSKIRSASMGLVEINGLATGARVITSPIKQVDCFYYRSMAWELRQQGKNRKWVKIAEESLHVPFYIDDGSGTLLVDPNGAEMDLHCDFREEYNHSIFSGGAEVTGPVGQFLSRHGADFARQLKVEEYCIKPKNFLFVLGTLAQNPAMSAESDHMASLAATAGATTAPGHTRPFVNAAGLPLLGANYRQIVHLQPESTPAGTDINQQQRISAALIQAGITNPAAWAVAGVTPQEGAQVKPYPDAGANRSLAKENASFTNAALDPHPPVVLMKGTHDPAYFISWRSQRDVVNSLGWKSALMIWGGPALTLFCIYLLLANFNFL
jgi:E3 ubiquitin ligase